MSIARGSFEVTIIPLEPEDKIDGVALGRMSLEKRFSGGFAGSGKGEMLTAGDPSTGSAGYVAVERVSGTLDGRRGSFALQHHATMHRGKNELSIEVVPGSATGELVGLAGKLSIEIVDGKHNYSFEYTFLEA